MPMAESAGRTTTPESSHAKAPAQAPIRVLVAEDNRDASNVFRELINAEPDLLCVGTVEHAAEILATAQRERARVVLLDVELNGASGMEVLELAHAEHPGIAFVVCSSHGNAGIRSKARALGAADFVLKPDDLNTLTATIRKAASA